MKKLVLFAAVVVAVSFASCKQKAAQEAAPVVDEVVATETVVDTTVVPADTIVEAVAVEEVK